MRYIVLVLYGMQNGHSLKLAAALKRRQQAVARERGGCRRDWAFTRVVFRFWNQNSVTFTAQLSKLSQVLRGCPSTLWGISGDPLHQSSTPLSAMVTSKIRLSGHYTRNLLW
jgi:hypothetical protein